MIKVEHIYKIFGEKPQEAIRLVKEGKSKEEIKRTKNINKTLSRLIIYIFLILISIVIAWPLIWMVTNAVKTSKEIWTFPPIFWPAIPQWQNFPVAWFGAPFTRYFFNSFPVFFYFLKTLFCLTKWADAKFWNSRPNNFNSWFN